MKRRRGHFMKRCKPAAERKLNLRRNKKKTQLLDGVRQAFLVVDHADHSVQVNCGEAHQSPLLPPRCTKMMVQQQSFIQSEVFLQKHPRLKPNMRSVLLDWLIEVSDAYTLHRQTFYLAQDYFDRFMLLHNDVEKGMLQLIGITCLFVASKVEEGSQPKLSDMAYVTAGTYYEEEILQMELIILKTLGWCLCPVTALSWLTFYFQVTSTKESSDVLEPQFPRDIFLQMTRLLDLCVLHMRSMDFQKNVLAASVLCYFVQQETVEKVSGLSSDAIEACVNWVAPFAKVAGLFAVPKRRQFAEVDAEDEHNIQTHADYLAMLECASRSDVLSRFPSVTSSTKKQNTP